MEALVIEDDLPIREVIRLSLEDEGFRVWTATTGREAVAIAAQRRPAVVVLDLNFSDGMHGPEIARRLQQIHGGDLPIVLVSAAPQIARVAREVRAAGCIPKPFDLDTLLDTVVAVARPIAGRDADQQSA